MTSTLKQAEIGFVIRPTAYFMLSHPGHLIAQGFGSGLSPVMPGTLGTLFSWLSYHALTLRWPEFFTPAIWLVVIAAGFLVGVWACGKTGRNMGVDDHGSMVWDEIIAFWLVLVFLAPADFSIQAWAFVWFRLFDMVKPPPISFADRFYKGGFGVMFDDLIAAFYTLLLFALWRLV
jgi:phosphatidylglycerophosphatase A